MNIPESYSLVYTDHIEEIGAEAYVLHHKKTGAHLILLETEDDNKVFNIAFKTPPVDDTGTPHILEHSVLCGSEKYPMKDPFVDLAKGSLNTFLNAMTFSEKTAYPVASCNDQDFKNLMSVYMDAVFHPNIYREEKIFRQEGWHYEMENKNDGLKVNGVVFNEMKGAFSDPDEVLSRELKSLLFPDTAYHYESGGDPEAIPTLSYEKFLAFHKRYYHPSNSFIYLYGNMDFEERLNWLDEAYLKNYDNAPVDSDPGLQTPFEAPVKAELTYGITEGEDASEANQFAWAKVVGGLFSPVDYLAYEVLSYALLNAPGAPLKETLLKEGIGADIYGGFDSSYREPVFSVYAKGGEKDRYEDFLKAIDRVLREQAEKGLNKKTLLAGINTIEFSLREADYGRYPKGLIYSMQINDTWLYDETKAFIHLKYNETFEALKKKVETDYFEVLLRKNLLDNPFGVSVRMTPEVGLTAKKEQAEAERLQKLKDSLSETEIEKIVRETKELKEYQETPDPEEAVRTIPMISVADIRKKTEPIVNENRSIAGIPVIFHDIVTSGILYLDLRFPLKGFPLSDFPYLALLKNLYTMLDTENYSYQALNDEISLYLGGLGADISTFCKAGDPSDITEHFAVRAKAVRSNVKALSELLSEVFLRTKFEDTGRIHEIISEIRIEMQNDMVNAGHSTALKRVLSYSSPSAAEDDALIGIGFFRFLEDLDAHYEERKEALSEKLAALSKKLFIKTGLLISLTGEGGEYEAVKEALPSFIDSLPETAPEKADRTLSMKALNEGFRTSSQVQYVAMGGIFPAEKYTGAFRVLKTLLGYDYLWQNVRVKGGAYGCFAVPNRNGELCFVSYRDPNLSETLEIFKGIPGYLRTLEIDDRDMEKYIIGTISESDTPLQPAAKGARSFAAYLTGLTEEQLQKERDQVLHCTPEDLKNLADLVEEVLQKNLLCVVGAEKKIENCRENFGIVTKLTGDGNE